MIVVPMLMLLPVVVGVHSRLYPTLLVLLIEQKQIIM
jgi:hypothetical protein